jgi:hypothetical protein
MIPNKNTTINYENIATEAEDVKYNSVTMLLSIHLFL